MDLEEQISQIVNPQDFTKLCNTIFTAHYGDKYQVIDGARGDEGNDGYISVENRLLAIHCPIKPERKTDRGYIDKIKSDLAKAAKLRTEGVFEIKCWSFVTPRKLSTAVIKEMMKMASPLGIEVNHIEATFLSNVLYEKKHLVQKFPFLHVPMIEEDIAELLKQFKEQKQSNTLTADDPTKCDSDHGKESDDLQRVNEIRSLDQEESSKPDLRTMIYTTADPLAKLNAILGLIQWFDPITDKASDMVAWCDEGIRIAEQQRNTRVQAWLLSHRGEYLSMQYLKHDTEYSSMQHAANTIGMSVFSTQEKERQIATLKKLEYQFEESFSRAFALAKKENSAVLYAEILLCVGTAAGSRYMSMLQFNMQEEMAREKQQTKAALLAAKDIYASIGDELGQAYAMHNLANNLRFYAEIEEAKALNKKVIEIAKKYGQRGLLQGAEELKERLETGKIPNYAGGYRRPLRK